MGSVLPTGPEVAWSSGGGVGRLSYRVHCDRPKETVVSPVPPNLGRSSYAPHRNSSRVPIFDSTKQPNKDNIKNDQL